MRKFLSLMLAMALIITTLALPVSVSAAAGKSDANITVSYTTDLGEATEVHPGDTFNLTVSITSDKDVTLSAYEIYVAYDKDDYTITAASDASYSIVESKWGYTGNLIAMSKNTDTELTAATAVAVATIPVTVASGATVNEASGFVKPTTGFVDMFVEGGTAEGTKECNFSDSELSYTINANTSSITIDGKAYEPNKLYINANGVTFRVTGTNIESVTYKQTDAETPTDITVPVTGKTSAEITTPLTAGAYEVSVKLTGVADAVNYTFRVSQEVVSGEIAINFTPKAEGYKAGETFEVPVKISGIGENKKGMASFDLVYDSARLELTTTTAENITIAPGEAGKASVSFGTSSTAASFPTTGDGNFVTLAFSVKSDAEIGKADITISNAQLTVKNDTDDIVYENNSSKITKDSTTVVVVPNIFATVNTSAVTDWTNTSYDVTVNPVSAPADQAISFKYVLLDGAANYADQNALKGAYESEAAKAVTGNKIAIDTDSKHYAIISEFNGVYSLVKDLVPGIDIWYDGTAPTINNAELAKNNMDSFAKSKDVTVTDLAIDAGGSNGVTYKYLVVTDGTTPTAETTGWADVTDKISFTESKVGKLYIMATDKAGNATVSTADVNIKVDVDDPTLTTNAGNDTADGTPITISATDITSNVTVKVYYSETDVDASTLTDSNLSKTYPEEGEEASKTIEKTYYAKGSGFYYISATDEAGNSSDVSKVQVTRAAVDNTSTLSVKVISTSTEVANVFDKETESNTASNGTFGYVGIKVAAPAENLKNTITATKGGEPLTLENASDLTAEYTHEFTEAGEYKLTVVTAHSTNTDAKATATYKFTIAADQTAMVSPSGDNRYNSLDYVMMRKVAANEELNGIPTGAYGFEGKYSGDLDGNFKTTTEDVDAILASIKEARIPGYYNFGIMTGTAAPAGE